MKYWKGSCLPKFGWKNLSHDEERYVGVATREGNDEEEKTGQRQPSQRHLNLVAVQLQHVEESSESSQGDGHASTGDEEQHPASGAIHQEHGSYGGHQLNDAYDDGRQVLVHRAASLVEDEHGEVDDGIDAAKLLQQHQTHRQEQRFQDGAFQQLARLDPLIALTHFQLVGLQTVEFGRDIRVAAISTTHEREQHCNSSGTFLPPSYDLWWPPLLPYPSSWHLSFINNRISRDQTTSEPCKW